MTKNGSELVEAVVRRDFHELEVDLVLSLLEQYGSKDYHTDKYRIRLSCLKLANGNAQELKRHLNVACVDFRDVVGAAEEPNMSKLGLLRMGSASKEALEQITTMDLDQYKQWIEAGLKLGKEG